jgi:hypothetical protein
MCLTSGNDGDGDMGDDTLYSRLLSPTLYLKLFLSWEGDSDDDDWNDSWLWELASDGVVIDVRNDDDEL